MVLIPGVPIHAFPTEVVAIIFAQASTPARSICLPLGRSASQPEIIRLTQVCRRWRAIAHKYVRDLWTSYRLDLTTHGWTAKASSDLLALLAQFVSYAGSKLDINLAIDQGTEASAYQITSAVVTTYARGLCALELQLPHKTVKNLFRAPPLPFDRLKRFEIVIQSHKSIDHDQSVLTAAPLLTQVVIGYRQWRPRHTASIDLLGWKPPLGQLTTLRALNSWITTDDLLTILRDCTQLIICDIRCDEWDESVAIETDLVPTTMAHLKELSITFPVALPHFWNCITAPRVEQLEITTMYDGPEDWGTEELLAFRERSGFTLRALALRMDLSDFPEDVVRFLQVVQEVEVLTLRWTGPQEEPDPHVSRLVREFAAATWCPNLHTLTIDATPETAAVLVSRCASQVAKGAVVQLRNITLAAEVEPQDLPAVFPREVNELRALGCNVTVEVMTFFGGEHFVGHGYQDQLAAFHAHGQWPGRDDDAEDDEDDEDESDESDTESDEIGKDGDEGDDGTTLDVEGQTS